MTTVVSGKLTKNNKKGNFKQTCSYMFDRVLNKNLDFDN